MCKEISYKRQNNAETAINARAKLESLAAWRNLSRNGAQGVIAYDAASVLHRIKKVYCERVIPFACRADEGRGGAKQSHISIGYFGSPDYYSSYKTAVSNSRPLAAYTSIGTLRQI